MTPVEKTVTRRFYLDRSKHAKQESKTEISALFCFSSPLKRAGEQLLGMILHIHRHKPRKMEIDLRATL